MKTINIMSIIGLVVFILTFICVIAWGDTPDNDAALGWGMIGSMYGVALSIVGIVQANKSDTKKRRRR